MVQPEFRCGDLRFQPAKYLIESLNLSLIGQFFSENTSLPAMLKHAGVLFLFHRHFNPEPAQCIVIVKTNGKLEVQLGGAFFKLNESFVDLYRFHVRKLPGNTSTTASMRV